MIRTLSLLGITAVCSACAHSNASSETTPASSVFPIFYVVRPGDHPIFNSRIDFSNELFIYSHRDGPDRSRSRSDAGGLIKYLSNQNAYFADDEPIAAPKPGVTQFGFGQFACSSEKVAQGHQTTCKRLDKPETFRSLFDTEAGIVWMDYYCTAHNTEICRFALGSRYGLFSKKMNAELGLQ